MRRGLVESLASVVLSLLPVSHCSASGAGEDARRMQVSRVAAEELMNVPG